jgi:DNA-directed RNA polymerase specialized sigma24 family protein
MSGFLRSPTEVARGLLTYTDWCQPATSSVIQVGAARRRTAQTDGIPPGLLRTLDERTELCRRMRHLRDVDREVLFLWYVRQLAVEEIASELRISRRQCFRRRSTAIRKIVELGEPRQAA